MSIAVITPPGQGGVRDFACRIVEGLEPHGKHCAWNLGSSADIEPFLENDNLYLQYSGYGYAKRGAPLWLLQELENKRHKIRKLGIFFHELYASGAPWSSAFWLSPLQRHIARRLAELSDFWITSRERSAQWLRRYAGGKSHAVLPVFSNIGELAAYSLVRTRKVVIFGGSGLRMAAYRVAGDDLFVWAKQQSLQIHDVGPNIKDSFLLNRLESEGVILHGRLEASEASQLLADAMFGLITYPVEYVAKSGVFAAYCSHGICPVLISGNYGIEDHLVPGQHYLPGIHAAAIDFSSATSVGESAWNWYQPHRLSIHVSTMQKLLGDGNHAH